MKAKYLYSFTSGKDWCAMCLASRVKLGTSGGQPFNPTCAFPCCGPPRCHQADSRLAPWPRRRRRAAVLKAAELAEAQNQATTAVMAAQGRKLDRKAERGTAGLPRRKDRGRQAWGLTRQSDTRQRPRCRNSLPAWGSNDSAQAWPSLFSIVAAILR
jgi:hypothetical protein